MEVFKSLDQIKRDNEIEVNEPKVATPSIKKIEVSHVQTNISKPTSKVTSSSSVSKPTIVTASSKDDDEWESF